ncbi:MAG: RluA family pseudouridine synthase [Lachnospiraceae bacterium]|nr:RluA family pseudouridine synthase [Lachnospiraceae bacterium]
MNILFRDEYIVVCIKPAGVVSEEAPGGMPELLRMELKKDAAVPQIFPVHRLDKGVGGVMVYAFTKDAAASLTRQMTESAPADAGKTFTKEYLAVTEGVPEPASGRMEDLLFHDREKNRTYVVKRPRKGVKEAVLEYETLASAGGDPEAGAFSLVRIRLLTGRTHQIRAQFSSRKLPLCGDRRYGAKIAGDIALWSHRLTFRHPETGEELTFRAGPPKDGPWAAV